MNLAERFPESHWSLAASMNFVDSLNKNALRSFSSLADYITVFDGFSRLHGCPKDLCESGVGVIKIGKAEFMNPGGSVKDRAALGIVLDAIKSGRLKSGGIIVEGTAGNTGIGLTHLGNALGFKTVIVIPNTQSPEKIDYLRALGADV